MALRAVGSVNTTTPVNWSGSLPPAVGLDGAVGAMETAARGDHTHAARIQRMKAVSNSSGEASVTFARPFAAEPVCVCLVQESTANQPIVPKVETFQLDGNGNYIGCTVQLYRAQTLPAVLTLLTQLLSFNIFGAPPPTGITVNIYAADATQ